MTEEQINSIITNKSLDIQMIENGNDYSVQFYTIEHLLSGLSVLSFSVDSLADYVTNVFSPSIEVDRPVFFNVIEQGVNGEIFIYTILALVKEVLKGYQSICVSEDDKELLHLVALDEFFNAHIKK